MYITIYNTENKPVGVADSKKLQRINMIDGNKLLFIFDNNVSGVLSFDHPPYDELETIINGLNTMEYNVSIYGVTNRQFAS